MINTLQNSPERVPSKWGNKFKKAVALAIALALSGKPAEAKTYEKQEFPTEMLASIPWEYTPMTENVEQATVPNYINQAQNWVKKYYPEYEEYFNAIFTRTYKLSTSSQNIVNTKIQENFDLFEEELVSEKDKVTTILLVLEKVISWQNQLSKSLNNTKKGKDFIEIAEEISNEINQQAREDRNKARAEINQTRAEINQTRAEINQTKQHTELIKKRTNKLKEIINYINSNEINKGTIGKIVDKIEEYFTLFEIKEIKEDEQLQKIIKHYINYTKQINRTPSNIWKNFIEEYNKINDK